MIVSLTGKLTARMDNWLVLEAGGVGYQVFVPAGFTGTLDQTLTLYCSHQIREDRQELYGFPTFAHRSLFEMLLTVSGVGPKSALGIMGIGSVERIQGAIVRGDPSLFESVSGIGKKAAAKIIVELKGKVAHASDLLPTEVDVDTDLVAALEMLGYRRHEILPLLAQVPTDLIDSSSKIRWALRELGRG